MKHSRKKCRTLVGVGSLIFLLALGVIVNYRLTTWDTDKVVSEHVNDANVSVIEQILNFERTRSKKQTVVGANRPRVDVDSSFKKDTSRGSRDNSYGDSIVSVSKNIKKGRMAVDDSVGTQNVDVFDHHEWLNDGSSIDALLKQAEEANREWTFGWGQLKYPIHSSEVEKTLRRFGARVFGSKW